jgi:hypothetical protein
VVKVRVSPAAGVVATAALSRVVIGRLVRVVA